MIRGFYYSKDFNGDEHFAISVKNRRVGRWSIYERAHVDDTVILWNNDNLIIGKIIGDGKTDNATWTGNHRFVAYPVEWTSPTKHTKDVFSKNSRMDAWRGICNLQEYSQTVQKILQGVVNPSPPARGPLDAFFRTAP